MINKAVPFALLPLLTHHLSPEEYGLIALFQVTLTLFQALYGGLPLNVARTFFKLSHSEFRFLFSAIFAALVLMLVGITVISASYLILGGPTFGIPIEWFAAFPIIAAMGVANLINLSLLRTTGDAWTYMKWEVGHAFLGLSTTILLVMWANQGWEGRAWGIAAPLAVLGILGTASLYKKAYLGLETNRYHVKEVFRISVPLIPHALGSIIILSSDRILISHFLGNHAVGVYTVGYQFGMVVVLFTEAFLKAWQPWFFRKLEHGRASEATIVRATYVYLLALIGGAVIYSYIGERLVTIFTDARYHDARQLVFPVTISYVAFGIYQIFMPYLVHVSKTKVLMVSTSLAASLNLVLNVLWIPSFGMLGAVYATIAAYSLSAVITIWASHHYKPMPWKSVLVSS